MFVFVLGCQENTIINPLPVEVINKKITNNNVTSVIILQRVLNNPYPVFNTYYQISGQLQYEITTVNSENTQFQAQQHLLVHLCITADLTEFCTVANYSSEIFAGSIVCESDDEIFVSGTYLLEKSYTIEGRDDEMKLVCLYSIADRQLTLDAVWLELPAATQNSINQNF